MIVGMTNIFKVSDGKLLPYFLSLYFIHCPDCFFPTTTPGDIIRDTEWRLFSIFIYVFSLLSLFILVVVIFLFFILVSIFIPFLFYVFEKNFFFYLSEFIWMCKVNKKQPLSKAKETGEKKMPRNWDGKIMKT